MHWTVWVRNSAYYDIGFVCICVKWSSICGTDCHDLDLNQTIFIGFQMYCFYIQYNQSFYHTTTTIK